jgi:hypothetical protein
VAYPVTYSAAIKRLERTVCPTPVSSHNARTCNHDLAGMVTIHLRHGSADPITAYNPLRVESAQRVDPQRDLAGVRSVRTIPGFLFKPSGGALKGDGNTTSTLRARR